MSKHKAKGAALHSHSLNTFTSQQASQVLSPPFAVTHFEVWAVYDLAKSSNVWLAV
jgi:hypothetical protein